MNYRTTNYILLVLLIISITTSFFMSRSKHNMMPNSALVTSYQDGTYRGTFNDRGEQQISLEFSLKNNKIADIHFRHLAYKGHNYLTDESEFTSIIKNQHLELLEHLKGKDVRKSVEDLYKPAKIIKDGRTDALTGATVRASKIISAIRDALNRGVYNY